MISILYSAVDDINLGNWFTVFKVLMLNVPMLTIFLHQSKFSLGLISVADFSNIGTRAPNSTECTPCVHTPMKCDAVWTYSLNKNRGHLSCAVFSS